MTVQETIAELQARDSKQTVYVLDQHGMPQILKSVSVLAHTNLPEGIAIPDDIVLTPWSHEEFTSLYEGQE